MRKNSDITEELLNIKERIEEYETRLERQKGQRIAVLNQLKEMSFTLPQAEQEQKTLQKKIEKMNDVLEMDLKTFSKDYPELS